MALNFADAGKSIVENILRGLKSAWEKVVAWVKNAVGWIKGIFGGATSSVSNADTGSRSSYNMRAMPALRSVEIPALAKGAVIPANRKFLAVLGDQTSGANIEAPADLIRQIVREEMNNASSGEEITIKFTGDLAQLARVLSPEITREQRNRQRALGV